ncbi:beta-ketoacyl-[acyl-carrier-protein] synthase family protein [uncultured Capnocytophaga sp.]|uniref:beta-ketoacyl-[acyl-carrier-protein] synthase family protein n=1 Tax=uncultured Capnocytophaga sp. TaxID=159273 RepID=UPI0025936C0B|nr:beta-ketoacyl-[acyl-carrier-protein] synthase family protein [uncultured Capnocytophaga sp.]
MPPKIVVTGMGIISSIGNSVEANFYALTHKRTGLSVIENLVTAHKNNIRVGEVKLDNNQLAEKLHLPIVNAYSRTSLLGIIAVKEAIANANLTPKQLGNAGFINASTVGGMDMTERYFFEYENSESVRRYITTHNIGDVTHQIADYFRLKGIVTSVSTACSSSANAIITAAHLLTTGRADCLIVGGSDALSKFTINGFNSLMILSDSECTPFDAHRKGLNLGEAAAYLVLETEENALRRGAKIKAVLSGWGNANDAYHQTASSEDGQGAYLAMQQALQIAYLQPETIDYINAHGTATPNNDLSESRALLRVFGERVPHYSSTKPFTGHTLGAASSVEAVFSVMALRNDIVFPNLNYQTPMPEVPIRPETELLHLPVRHVLSNSFGFGGNCSALIFSKK